MATRTELFSIFLRMLMSDRQNNLQQSFPIIDSSLIEARWLGSFPLLSRKCYILAVPTVPTSAWAQRPTNYGKLFFNNIAGNRILGASDRSGKLESWNHFKCPISFNCSCDTILHWFATIATLPTLRQLGSPGHYQASFHFSNKELLKNVWLYRKHF